MKNLEHQIGEITKKIKGKSVSTFSSNTEPTTKQFLSTELKDDRIFNVPLVKCK